MALAPEVPERAEVVYACQRALSYHRGSALSAQPILFRDIVQWLNECGIDDHDDRLYIIEAVRRADAHLLDFLRELSEKRNG